MLQTPITTRYLEMTRPTVDQYYMSMVQLVASRATCARRQVGCILVNEDNHVLSTGYNGTPYGITHCTDTPCAGVSAKSGTSLEACKAVHAEQNALLQCQDVSQIVTAYVTASPCITCTKLLMNTGCKRIVFLEEYPHQAAKEMWLGEWIHYTKEEAEGLSKYQITC